MTTAALLWVVAVAGLGDEPKAPAQAIANSFQPDPSWKQLATELWFDPTGKRVVIRARVALRDGTLEHLLCLRHTKEHEAVLATVAPAMMIHAALLLTGAKPGKPVQFQPTFEPPTGPPILIELEWLEDGKLRHALGRDWVKDGKTGKPPSKDWVFAGSLKLVDPQTNKTIYAADDGDLITVANFPSAILDLPFASSADDADRAFVANTPRIPPSGTLVTMFLRPAPEPAKQN
jgi:hypothetical protein